MNCYKKHHPFSENFYSKKTRRIDQKYENRGRKKKPEVRHFGRKKVLEPQKYDILGSRTWFSGLRYEIL